MSSSSGIIPEVDQAEVGGGQDLLGVGKVLAVGVDEAEHPPVPPHLLKEGEDMVPDAKGVGRLEEEHLCLGGIVPVLEACRGEEREQGGPPL